MHLASYQIIGDVFHSIFTDIFILVAFYVFYVAQCMSEDLELITYGLSFFLLSSF